MKKPSIKLYRRTLQIGVAVAFIVIPFLNHIKISIIYGNFLSFHAGKFPLADPLAVLQITLKNAYLSFDLLIGAGIALGLGFILGTVFCSWICPFGLLSELTYEIGRRFLSKKHKKSIRNTGAFRFKIVIFLIGLSGFLVFSTTPVLNQLSMPAWYSRIFQFYFEQKHLSLAIIMLIVILFIEFMVHKRLWCRYICPQGILIILAKNINPVRMKVGFQEDKCLCKKGRDPCRQACSLSLDPKHLNHMLETECNNCGDCIVACKKMGKALQFQFKIAPK